MTAKHCIATGADISSCGTYRYGLWRAWETRVERRVLFVMVNPSRAAETVDDNTSRKCIEFAQRWGMGALDLGNLFALRSTDPEALYAHADPVGPDNDTAIARMVAAASLVVCAWGVHGGKAQGGARATAVKHMLRTTAKVPVVCLGFTKARDPVHPLYQPYDVRLVGLWERQHGLEAEAMVRGTRRSA